MGSPLTFQYLFEIDVTPEESSETWARVGPGLSTASGALNEELDQKAYLDGDGSKSTNVIANQLTYSFSGERLPGDTAQDFVFDRIFALGDSRITTFRMTDAAGGIISGPCTICNVVPPGGDANSAAAFGFDIHLNGKPTYTEPAEADDLTATVAAGTVVGTTSFTATAGQGNRLAYRLTASPLTANEGQYIAISTPYTSGANIPAVAGQSLNMYELNAYGRVVNFATHVLLAADIDS